MSRPRRFQRTQQFIFVWPGDELKRLGYDGNSYNMPPFDQVSEIGLGKPYGHEPAKDASGRPIPGTIVIEDRYADNEMGGTERVLDAAEFCGWIEDTMPELLNQGFAIVMGPEDVAQAMDLGRPKYEASRDDYARAVLQHELERRKTWEGKGIPPPVSSSDAKVRWAASHLENAQAQARSRQISDDALRDVLAGRPTGTIEGMSPAPAPEPLATMPTPEEMPEPAPVLTPGDIYEQAIAAGITPTKPEMAKLLKGDKEYAAVLLGQIAEKQEGQRATA